MGFRHRTRGEIVQDYRHYTETAFNGNVITSTTSPFTSLLSGEFETMTDVITPRWRQKSSSGAIVNNPMSKNKLSYSHSFPGFHHRRKTGSGNTIRDYVGDGPYNDCDINPGTPTMATSALRAEAGTQAAAGVDKPVIEGLVEAAEWHKTMDLLKVRSDKLSRAARYILSKSASKRFGVISGGWLKYRYGIMPIIHSMDALLQDWNGRIITTRRTSRGSASNSVSGIGSSSSGGFFWDLSAENSHELTVEVRAGVLYEQYLRSNRYGFSPSDLPAAAWELVPYSFVADWFINAGDFIRAWTPKAGVRSLATWTTVTTTLVSTQTVSAVFKQSASYDPIQAPTGFRRVQSESISRSPGISRALTLKESAVTPVLTSKRVLDSFALAFNLLRR
jgi:hypothetical protein